MLQAYRTTSQDKQFRDLVSALDADLAIRDGDDHAFYHQFNSITTINHVVLALQDAEALGCGAIKMFEPGVMEVKRMYTPPAHRGKGIASFILQELETWARELGYQKCILETGIKQPEAIALYKKCGYHIIPNYGQYAGVENSVCFEKIL